MSGPPLPRYGSDTIAEILPSALAVLAGDGPDPLGLADPLDGIRRVCVFLIDGLGRDVLDAHAAVAPTLARLREAAPSRVLDTCFPSTTATSIASLGTGLAPGRHGMVGYTAWLREVGAVVNLIRFNRYGDTKGGVLPALVPEQVQPHSTVFERAAAAGIATTTVSDARFARSALTRAALRGPEYVGWGSEEEIPELAAGALAAHDRCLVYAYDARLDHVAHGAGVASAQAAEVLAATDTLVARLCEGAPAATAVIVTGDHGMVDVDGSRFDLDDEPALAAGVRAVGGEPRIRHLYVHRGAAADVASAWDERLGELVWVASRDEAIGAGWFGPHVQPEARSRIGDVVVAFRAEGGVFCRRLDPRQAELRGHHGSFTPAESKIPLLVALPS